MFPCKRDGSEGYGTITCHFIDSNFVMNDLILEFERVRYPHDASTIAEFIKEVIFRFKLERKIVGMTTDNGQNVVAAIDQLKFDLDLDSNHRCGFIHLRCIAHVLNSGVKEALKQLTPSIVKVRSIVTSIRSSTKRREQLENIQLRLIHAFRQDNLEENEGIDPQFAEWEGKHVQMEAHGNQADRENQFVQGIHENSARMSSKLQMRLIDHCARLWN